MSKFLQIETDIIKVLKEIYDPEIPVNIYDLGLIYEIDVKDNQNVDIEMTLTAPNCPIADQIFDEVKEKVSQVKDVKNVELKLVFDPPWTTEMMTEEAKLELGFL